MFFHLFHWSKFHHLSSLVDFHVIFLWDLLFSKIRSKVQAIFESNQFHSKVHIWLDKNSGLAILVQFTQVCTTDLNVIVLKCPFLYTVLNIRQLCNRSNVCIKSKFWMYFKENEIEISTWWKKQENSFLPN